MIERNSKILVVGLGLMGGSYAQRLSDIGYQVYGIDIDVDSIKKAKKESVILNEDESNEELIKKCNIIICCLYPSDTVKWILGHQHLFLKDCIISDISGVKGNVVEQIQSSLRSDVEFISMHPMAGRESKGFDNRDTNIFLPANMIVVPTKRNSKKAIDFAYDLSILLRFKNIEILDVEQHDLMIGYLSQLPHAIAVSLINCHESSHLEKYTGDSFRDLTRIAKINETLWSELFFENKDNLIPLIEDFIKELNKLKDCVANEDIDSLRKMFIESTQKRKAFDK